MSHLPALVVLLNVLLLFAVTILVSRARGKYAIKAPATSGHPLSERAYRIQMNTLEQTVLFLPTLWLAVRFGNASWAGVLGLVWIIGRIVYAVGYSRDPARREAGFVIGMLAWLGLLILACYGVIRLFA